MIKNVTSGSFEAEVLKSDEPVLVDFWAPWCGPCKTLTPILEEVASESTDVKIVKVNVDENMDLSATYGIRSVPTMILFNKEDVVATITGASSKQYLTSFLEQHLHE